MNASSSLPSVATTTAHRAGAMMNGADSSGTDHMTSAAQRLEQSRERLLRAMAPPAPRNDSRQVLQEQRTQELKRQTEGLQHGTSFSPGTPRPVVQLMLAKARSWWSVHPLHHAGKLAVESAEAAARPMVRQHPVAWLAAAAVCGGLLVYGRPWRFVNRRVVAAALVPGVLPGLLPGLLRTVTPLLVPLLIPRVGPAVWARVVHALGALVPGPAAAAGSTTAKSTAAGIRGRAQG